MSRNESLADAFLLVMERVRSIDADVSHDDPDRHAYWRLKALAEAFIADGFRRAADVHDITLAMKLQRERDKTPHEESARNG